MNQRGHDDKTSMFCCIITVISIILIAVLDFIVRLFSDGPDQHSSLISSGRDHWRTGGDLDNAEDHNVDQDYPLRRKRYPTARIDAAFKAIKSFEYKLVQTPYKILNMPDWPILDYKPLGGPILIECQSRDYETMNWLSDYFNEQCRIKCQRYDEVDSPYSWFVKNKQAIMKHSPDGEIQSDFIYEHVRGCGNFRPGLLVGMIKHLQSQFGFSVRRVLDPCSGWGDRLIGAIASGVSYTGVDPNTCLVDGYQGIIDRFADDPKKYQMICEPIQTANIIRGDDPYYEYTYDLVFTSPPYFNLEKYEAGCGVKSDDVNVWVEEFLRPMLIKCVNALSVGGFICMIINDIRGHEPYVAHMHLIMDTMSVEYLGVMSYADKTKWGYKSPQPMWMWRKRSTANDFSITIEEYPVDSARNVKVIRDDLLPGGTKQRGIDGIELPPGTTEIIYAGPWNGAAQVALALAARQRGIKATAFLSRNDYYVTTNAKEYGLNVMCVGKTLTELQVAATKYADEIPTRYVLPFGFASPGIIAMMTNNIIYSLGDKLDRNHPYNIWLVAGSATLLGVLYKVFPNAKFNIVQVGKTVWDDQMELDRTTKYIAPEKFFEDATILPPYPSAITYDAKAWQFVIKHATDGDLVWNVFG